MNNYKERLHKVIPGGAHTYSRGDDQFPANAPVILERGEGAYVWDPEGKKYLDYGMGLRSVNIGYGNKEIADAAYHEIMAGNNLTRASVTELHAAEMLVDLIPSVDMIKFAKHGSTVVTAAVKLSRAYTGKKYVIIPAQQPFFSFDDWFIGSTVLTRGVPQEQRTLTLKFDYNDIGSLEKLFDEYAGEIACVLLEPAALAEPAIPNAARPEYNFLHQVRDLCHKNGTVFILDEMITGFRWHLQGAQTHYHIEPDLCTFGKAMANGFAVAALCGKREIMKIGGISEEGSERVFLTSTTHGAEMSALGAFLKTIEVMKRENVIGHFWNYGESLKQGINKISREMGMLDSFYAEGVACSPAYTVKDNSGAISLPLRTLFAQEMIKRGIIMPYIAISYAHSQADLEFTLQAVRESLEVVKAAHENGHEQYLHSSVIKPVFRKYN